MSEDVDMRQADMTTRYPEGFPPPEPEEEPDPCDDQGSVLQPSQRCIRPEGHEPPHASAEGGRWWYGPAREGRWIERVETYGGGG